MNSDVPCFFTVIAVDEAAQVMAEMLSPGSAADIISVSIQSLDFLYDVMAVNKLDQIVGMVANNLEKPSVSEQFNPMFLPQKISELDEMLELQLQSDAVRFVGLDGNPFTIKLSGIKQDDETLLTGKVTSHPFDLPSYTEIVQANERAHLN